MYDMTVKQMNAEAAAEARADMLREEPRSFLQEWCDEQLEDCSEASL